MMRLRRLGFLLLLATALLFIYARWIEPAWIEVTRHRITANIDRPLKVVQLADLHTRSISRREEKVLAIIQREKPDVIVISGDTVANAGDWNSVKIFLQKLAAPFGVFLVRGNWEHWRPDPHELKIYQDANITFLNNESRQITQKIWISGIDDSLAGSPDLERAFAQVPSDSFRIALFHSPAFFDSLDDRSIHLALTGHTHAGQVRLPFLPPLWLPEGSGEYVEGWYARGSNKMYVSRGIGNSILELRFFCRPEVSIFYLDPFNVQ